MSFRRPGIMHWPRREAILLIDGVRVASSSWIDVDDADSRAEQMRSISRATSERFDVAIDATSRAQPRWATLRCHERAFDLANPLGNSAEVLEEAATFCVGENGGAKAEADEDFGDVVRRNSLALGPPDQRGVGCQVLAPTGRCLTSDR